MFLIQANKNRLTVSQQEDVTSGSVNVNKVRFVFSEEWAQFQKIAVFRVGSETASVLLGDDGECMLPWELLDEYGRTLYAGVYGTLGDSIVLTTTWANLGTVQEGAVLGPDAHPPTPELWEQELARKGESLGYTEAGDLGLYAGGRLLSAVPVVGGGEGGGATDHRALSHRSDVDQHPIGAISGLEGELLRIPAPVEALTNTELEELLK